MFTNNYYKWLSTLSGGSATGVDMSGKTNSIGYGGDTGLNLWLTGPAFKYAKIGGTNSSISFGTGTAAPSLDDYKLSGTNVTSSFTILSETSETYTLDNGYRTVKTFMVQNTTTNDITVGEIGWSANVYYDSSIGAGYSYRYMLDRTLLDEPLTIPAGQTAQIDYAMVIEVPSE